MNKIYLLLFVASATIIYTRAYPFSKNYTIQVSVRDTTYRIISADGNTYGYEILVKDKLLIHQPNIPGIPGKKGFQRKSDAEKIAKLVIKKIQNGMMPPTIEKKELDSLGIKY